jgi:hypothetical protein
MSDNSTMPTAAAATAAKSLPDARQMRATSRTNTLRSLDGRTREARRLKTITADLVTHLGGPEQVSAAQRFLIERIAVDIVRLEVLDSEAANGAFSEHDGRVAHALRNSVRLALKDLGWQAAAAVPPDERDTDNAYVELRTRILRSVRRDPEASRILAAALADAET